MGKRNYREMLEDRIEKTFQEWEQKEMITEAELYRFLHTLKGTSGTIGMDSLSAFCSAQLDILSANNESVLPVHTLSNFKSKLWRVVEGAEHLHDFQLPAVYANYFEEDINVLLIDDDLEFVSFVKELLEKMGAEVVIALNGKRGIEQFYSMRPQFVLIDLHLPDMTGFEVLDHISETAAARLTTVAITSVDDSQANKITAYERGAMDFLGKPLKVETFIPYLINRDNFRKTIGKSVITDGLTGVGNRRHFDEMSHYFAEHAKRSDSEFTLVMLDLDHFKKVNDSYGHPAGDEVLRKLGSISIQEKRETDYVFRYGGEEFAFILPGSDVEDAVTFVNRLRKRFAEHVFTAGDHAEQFTVTFSAGIAKYKGDLQQLVSEADQALYDAKRKGRNRAVIYSSSTQTKRKLHVIIVDDDPIIRAMLSNNLADWTMPGIDVDIQLYSDGPSFLESDWYCPEEHHVVLLDGVMPEMDGLEVLGRLKRERDDKNVVVSMMTGRTSDSDIKAALWLGADDYIMKPFHPKEMVSRVHKLASRILQ